MWLPRFAVVAIDLEMSDRRADRCTTRMSHRQQRELAIEGDESLHDHAPGTGAPTLLELPTGLSPAQLHGEAPLPRQLTLTAGVERAFLDRCRLLPQEVQTLLLVAAADATGRVATVRRAAAALGADARAWGDAERSNLLTISGDTVTVRHPLVRSAVYQAATSFEQRQVHRALAQAVGAEGSTSGDRAELGEERPAGGDEQADGLSQA